MPSSRALSHLLASVFVASLLPAVPASAQVLRGTVRSNVTDAPISGTRVTALTGTDGREEGSATTDSIGEFVIRVGHPGIYRIAAVHPAFLAATFAEVEVEAGEEVTLSLRLVDGAVPLPPLEVVGRRTSRNSTLDGYFDRLQRYGRGGPGRFLTRQAIADVNPPTLMQALQVGMGLRVQYRPETGYTPFIVRGTSCVPRTYLDGMSIEPWELDALVPPSEIEGVEVYSGPVQPPPAYADRSGCGVILVWSRRDSENMQPMTWRRWATFGGLVGLLLGTAVAF
ncbi:MAG: carboxypeptidase regulatory-like domain-containing protein [Gemmatimonadota bacterium]